jgi:hypothetical protein
MRLPRDARPAHILSDEIVAGAVSIAAGTPDLWQVITCISGGVFTSETAFYTVTLAGTVVIIQGIWSGSATPQGLQQVPLWIPVPPSTDIQLSFNSDDSGAQLGFVIAGWQYASLP